MSVTVTCLLLLFSTLIINGTGAPVSAKPADKKNDTAAETNSQATGSHVDEGGKAGTGAPESAKPADKKNDTAAETNSQATGSHVDDGGKAGTGAVSESAKPADKKKNDTAAETSSEATGSHVDDGGKAGTGAVSESAKPADKKKNDTAAETSSEATGSHVDDGGKAGTQVGSVKDNAETKNTTVAPSSEEIGSPEVGDDTNIEYIDSGDETDSYDEAFDEDDDAAASYASDDELDGIDVEDDDLAAEMDVDEDEEPGDKLNDGGGGDDEATDLDAGHGAVTVDVPKSTQFLPYFIAAVVAFVFLYLAYHQRNKIMAFVIEGKRSLAKRKREPRPKAGEYTRITTSAEDVDTRTKGFTF